MALRDDIIAKINGMTPSQVFEAATVLGLVSTNVYNRALGGITLMAGRYGTDLGKRSFDLSFDLTGQIAFTDEAVEFIRATLLFDALDGVS